MLEKGYTFIYGLIDPVTKEVRYIGKSNRPKKRYTDHLRDCSGTHKANWIQKVLRSGKRPILKIIKKIKCSRWEKIERSYIRKFKNLTNFTEGGEGGITFTVNPMLGKTHTPEARAKISKANKGKIISEEQKKLVSKKLKGRMTGAKNPNAKAYRIIYKDGSSKTYTGCTHEMHEKEHVGKKIFYELIRKERKNHKHIKTVMEIRCKRPKKY